MKPVTLLLVAANVLAYLLELGAGGQAVCGAYGLIPAHFVPGALVTSMFLHDSSSLAHIAGNMVFLAFFGAIAEEALGGGLFLALYLASGAAGGLLHIAVNPHDVAPLVGASGAIFGVMAVAGAVRPRLMGFVVAFGAVNVWHAIVGGGGDVSFACHIGGICAGFVAALVLRVVGSEALEAA